MILYIFIFFVVLYISPIIINTTSQLVSFKNSIKTINKTSELKTYLLVIKALFRALTLKINQYLYGTRKNGKKTHIVNFYHNYTEYSIPIIINRGPKTKYRFFASYEGSGNRKEIDFSKFLGPNSDMYNITTLKPADFSLPNLFVISDKKEYFYDYNDFITCFYSLKQSK
jgi:hypothetical protein